MRDPLGGCSKAVQEMEQTETGACAEGLENKPVQEDRTDRTRA